MENEQNAVTMVGIVTAEPTFYFCNKQGNYYKIPLSICRKSDAVDIIPIVISEKMLEKDRSYKDVVLSVKGEYQSFNWSIGSERHLILYVMAFKMDIVDKSSQWDYENDIQLEGCLCKPPIHRKTPLGRVITDLLIGVQNADGKSSYIPCITWGRGAVFSAGLETGERVKISGRIQSRTYKKKYDDENIVEKTVYEVSTRKIEAV